MRFLKEVPRLMLAPVVVGVMALFLHLLGIVPVYLQSISDNEYNSVEEAESALGFEIVTPVYFPSYLAWPPAKILVQTEPVPMVQMVFLSSDNHTETLLINQIASTDENLTVSIPWIETVRNTTRVTINDSEGELVSGKRADGQSVNAVHWQAKSFHFVVATNHPVRELLILARSMHPRNN